MQNKERAEELLELISKERYFTKLNPENKKDNTLTIPLKVSSYNELNLMVSDLLKASIILLNPNTKGLSGFTTDNDLNAMTLLEIALQLLPEEEMELLDEFYRLGI